MTIGSRAEVLHGTADQTAGGLKKKDLVLAKDGQIKSKQAVKSALARMKSEGKAAMLSLIHIWTLPTKA